MCLPAQDLQTRRIVGKSTFRSNPLGEGGEEGRRGGGRSRDQAKTVGGTAFHRGAAEVDRSAGFHLFEKGAIRRIRTYCGGRGEFRRGGRSCRAVGSGEGVPDGGRGDVAG